MKIGGHFICLFLLLTLNTVAQKNEIIIRGYLIEVGQEFYFHRGAITQDSIEFVLRDTTNRFDYLLFFKNCGINEVQNTMIRFCEPYFACGDLEVYNRFQYKLVELRVSKIDTIGKSRDDGFCYYKMGDTTNSTFYFKRSTTTLEVRKIIPL